MDANNTERDRIRQLMEAEGLNSIQFANETGIKSATLSHILNGRNNPSSEIMKKILERFRTVNLEWFYLGVGQMYRHKTQPQSLSLFDIDNESSTKSRTYTQKKVDEIITEKNNIQQNFSMQETIKPTETIKPNEQIETLHQTVEKQKSLSKIIVYFSDNTFQEFYSK